MSQSVSLPSSGPAFLPTPETGDISGVRVTRKSRAPECVGVTNLEFAESQLENYLRDRNSVSPDWRDYFDEMRVADSGLTPE
ncbi:MAG: 2-oxoglutarate dehydrogenase N-terminus, partial [Planctomycetota bacterium]